MEELKEEEGMTYDEMSMKHSTRFLNSLQELRNLKPQLYYAADYCEKSYLLNQQKRRMLVNSKDYAVKALVNAVDHLGNVASQLDGLLSQEAAKIAATEVRISSLRQRVLTSKEYSELKAVRQQCLVQTFPRYHKHYVVPETGVTEAVSDKKLYIELERERARLQPLHLGETQSVSIRNSNSPFSSELPPIPSFPASAYKASFPPDFRVSVSSTSATSSCSQSASGTPRTPITSHTFGSGWKDREVSKCSYPFGNSQKKDVQQPSSSKGFLSSFFNSSKSAKKRPSHVS